MSKPFFPEGPYRGKIVGQRLSKAGTGTEQLELDVVVLDESSRGLTRTVYHYFTPRSIEFTHEVLRELGFTGQKIECLDPRSPGFVNLSGVECELYCTHDEYRGRVYEKWRINTRRKRVAAPLDLNEMNRIETVFANGLKQLGRESTRPIVRPAQAVSPPTYTPFATPPTLPTQPTPQSTTPPTAAAQSGPQPTPHAPTPTAANRTPGPAWTPPTRTPASPPVAPAAAPNSAMQAPQPFLPPAPSQLRVAPSPWSTQPATPPDVPSNGPPATTPSAASRPPMQQTDPTGRGDIPF